MKDYMKVFEECLDDLHGIGIYPRKINKVVVNSRAKRRWGQAFSERGKCVIEISSRLVEDDVPDRPLQDTMMHELLHCVPGGQGHKGKWKALAEKCNNELGTTISRCSDYDGEIPKNDYKYRFRCKDCGQMVCRERRSKFVDNYRKYRCGVCGGKFEKL